MIALFHFKHAFTAKTIIILFTDEIPFGSRQLYLAALTKQNTAHFAFKGLFAARAIFIFMLTHNYSGTGAFIFLRNVFAAWTIAINAWEVSSQPRVFKPQSGFTHRRSAGI